MKTIIFNTIVFIILGNNTFETLEIIKLKLVYYF